MTSLISKARKPKFELHLKIYDLNNVPLVSGGSFIKWHLPHSIHKEHRGRTQKCPIANHRVEYNYCKVISLRIAIDKTSNLSECPIEFEVLQEFSVTGTAGISGRDEKVSLGVIRLNLSEYVEESEAILRDGGVTTSRRVSINVPTPGDKSSHHRKRSSASAEPDASPRSSHPASDLDEEWPSADVRDGVVRRYLMQDSRINSTLKISILMVQVDGERNFVAPPLKTAAVFGGIAGFVANDALEPVDTNADAPGRIPSVSSKAGDMSELQDMYRRALAASWASQPDELLADQCIEDIFAGGNGFRNSSAAPQAHSHSNSKHNLPSPGRKRTGMNPTLGNSPQSTGSSSNRREGSGSTSGDEDHEDMMGTLRPRDLARVRHRLRGDSAASERSTGTVLMDRSEPAFHPRERGSSLFSGGGSGSHRDLTQLMRQSGLHTHRRDLSRDTDNGGGGSGLRSRSDSAASLATTLGSSDRGRDGFKRAREVDEFEVRDDLVAWAVPGVHS
ncbi:N-terminal C2 in EEIG1 and EHBP1 proteins-domain-containing protein [Echria macrotheca]|uniref:N-terminal C2 in EEIG1 and EHBP1 proteins-domain-containing protein n=1 Tax=Echria macrotheca TaxID=438768 RepID=A0AAJ0B338_9PEZI|nr:N-terminal C2 in EEIG1 and EHBP1 proteins-domain-containing protein [Echria macrotheca]